MQAACTLPDVAVRADTQRSREVNTEGTPARATDAAVGDAAEGSRSDAGPDATTAAEPAADGGDTKQRDAALPVAPIEDSDEDAGPAGPSDRAWSDTETLELSGSRTRPGLVLQPDGAAILLWQQPNASPMFPTVSSKRYARDGGWSETTTVFDGVHSNASPFALAADASGNVTALIWSGETMWMGLDPLAWTRSSMGDVLETRSSDGGRTWTTPSGIAVTPLLGQSAFSLSAVDSGEAVVVTTRVVEEGSAVGWVLEASHLPPGGAWSAPVPVAKATASPTDSETVQAAASEVPSSPGTSLSSAGEAAFIWRSLSSGVSVVVEPVRALSARSAPSQMPTQLSAAPPTSVMSNPYEPRVAWDNAGHAHAVWLDHNGTYWTARASRYTAGSGWAKSTALDTNVNGDAAQPQLAIDSEGNALAVWTQFESASVTVWYGRCNADGVWSAPERITPLSGNADQLALAVDRAGGGIAVWEDLGLIRASHYSVARGWHSTVQLSPGNQVAQLPTAKLYDQGDAIVIWSETSADKLALHLRRWSGVESKPRVRSDAPLR